MEQFSISAQDRLKIDALRYDSAFIRSLTEAKDAAQVRELFAAKGIELTIRDILAAKAMADTGNRN